MAELLDVTFWRENLLQALVLAGIVAVGTGGVVGTVVFVLFRERLKELGAKVARLKAELERVEATAPATEPEQLTLEGLPVGIPSLANIGKVRRGLADLLAQPSEVARVHQTFVANSYIRPSADLLLAALEVPQADRPIVTRLFSISRPLDIHFAAHSLRLREKYGHARMSIYVYPDRTPKPVAQSFVNLTVVDDATLVTFPARVDRLDAEQDPSRAPDTDDLATGVIVPDRAFASASRGYVDNVSKRVSDSTPEQKLRSLKLDFWNNRASYLQGLGAAIVGEVQHQLPGEHGFMGVVGSAARKDEATLPNDLDLVLTFDELTEEMWPSIEKIVSDCCGLYSLDGLRFEGDFASAPIHATGFHRPGVFPIHVLVNTKATVDDWSPFIRYRRSQNYVAWSNKEQIGIFAEDRPRLEDVFDHTHGIRSCAASVRKIIAGSDRAVPGQKWVSDGAGGMKRDRIWLSADLPIQQLGYLRYALFWSVANIRDAEEDILDLQGSEERNNLRLATLRLADMVGVSRPVATAVLASIDRENPIDWRRIPAALSAGVEWLEKLEASLA